MLLSTGFSIFGERRLASAHEPEYDMKRSGEPLRRKSGGKPPHSENLAL